MTLRIPQQNRAAAPTIHDWTQRCATPADYPRLAEIWWQASLEAHGFLGADRLQAQRWRVERDYLPVATLVLACRDDEIVGFIGLLDDWIGGLFVDPAWQRQGVGRMLVQAALRRQPGLALEVYADNRKACAFYAALGFRVTAQRQTDDDGLPWPLLAMRHEAG